jgi:hypothetical protein
MASYFVPGNNHPEIRPPEIRRDGLIVTWLCENISKFDMSHQTRAVMFTLNNYTENDVIVLSNLHEHRVRGNVIANYVIFQKEVGREGTPHLQGYMEFPIARRWVSLKRVNDTLNRCHFENRRGNQEQAIAYCSKTGTNGRVANTALYEFGEKKTTRQGQRTDLKDFCEGIYNGTKKDDLIREQPEVYAKFSHGLDKVYSSAQKHRELAPKILIYYSEESGTGKSWMARHLYPEAYHAPWPTGGRWWWPGYDQQETVVLDEFRHQVKMDVLLRMFDYNPMWIECKGYNLKFNSKTIVITTNIAPWRWYPKLGVETAEPLMRRIREFGKIFKFAHPMEWIEEGEEDEDGDVLEERRPKPVVERIQLEARIEPEEVRFNLV